MPYRRLPEAGRARVQFDQTLDRRIRALERRSRYSGAMRVVEADTVATTTGTSGAYLSLHLSVGSWLLVAGCNLVYAPANAISESANVSIRVYDDNTDAELLPRIGPPARWIIRGITVSTGLTQPFTVFGHGHFTVPVRADLYVIVGLGGGAHAVAIEDLCLQASPA